MVCTRPRKIFKNISRELHPDGMSVPCGKCPSCLKQHSLEWATRMVHELKFWTHACFVTLTYDDEHLPQGQTLVKEHLTTFFKSLRNLKLNFRYYACGEYGTKRLRPHYHAIIFGIGVSQALPDTPLPPYLVASPLNRDGIMSSGVIVSSWPYGLCSIGSVSMESCRYVAQYVDKKVISKADKVFYDDCGLQVPFQLQSKGIGKCFALNNAQSFIDSSCTLNGINVGVPRYYQKVLGLNNNRKFLKRIYDKACKVNKSLARRLICQGVNLSDSVDVSRKLVSSLKQSEANIKAKIRNNRDRKHLKI